MIFKRFTLSLLLLFAAYSTFFNVTDSAAQRSAKNQKFVVNKIKLDGNIILDDRSLSKSTELGSGVQMNNLMRELLIAEMEGYYSSQGFYLVQANFPKIKPKNEILTLFIDEGEEIKRGNSERERAEQAVTRLASYRDLQIPELNRQDAINKLMQGFKTKRILEAELEKKQREKQKANLMLELKKRAAQEAAKNKIKEKEWSSIMEKMKKFLENPNSQIQSIPWEKDFQSAQASVNRLIENNQFEMSPEMKHLAITKLTKTYRSKRQERLMALKKLRSKSQGMGEAVKTDLVSSELSKLKQSLIDSKSKSKFVPWAQDYKKAQTAVDQLIAKKQLKVSPVIKKQVIVKLIKAYREKRLGQVLESNDFESESETSVIKPDINKAMDLDDSEVSKMRKRIKTIMAGQIFPDKPEKNSQKMKKRLIEIQSKQNFDL